MNDEQPREPLTILVAPANGKRQETGPVQFGPDDWPGVFFRGDDALQFANILEKAIRYLPREHWPTSSVLNGLVRTLRSCKLGETGWPP